MPVFRSDQPIPDWCELRAFEIVQLEANTSRVFDRHHPKETVIAGRNSCRVVSTHGTTALADRQVYEVPDDIDRIEIHADDAPLTVIWMSGRWGSETGGAGVFGGIESDDPKDGGDPVDYPKRTNFDSHYHDCDEYWIVFEGGGTAVSEGETYHVGPGDCVATGMGHHHDFPRISSPLRSVFFETTLEGQKRRGHLWDHTHGQAQPRSERI